MHRHIVAFLFLASALALTGCDCEGSTTAGGPCQRDNAPPQCGDMCSATAPCPSGFYCSNSACTADCLTNADCGGGICGPDGICIAGGMDGAGPDGSVDSARPDGDPSDVGERPDRFLLVPDTGNVDAACPSVEVSTMRATPQVLLIIDRSSSMSQTFDQGRSRWDSVEDALIADDGLIDRLQASVAFGFAMYTRGGPEGHPGCPDLITEPVALDNLSAIRPPYQAANPGDGTPTGEAIEAVIAQLDTLIPAPRDAQHPVIFVLATDGDPDLCNDRDDMSGTAKPRSVGAVQMAYQMGIPTYVISVGEGVVATDHLQDLANAGQGLMSPPAGQEAQFFVATNTSGLVSALESIVGEVIPCELSISGALMDPSEACEGQIRIGPATGSGGRTLTCGTISGGADWELVSPGSATERGSIRLSQTACDEVNDNGWTVRGTFPCDTVIVPF